MAERLEYSEGYLVLTIGIRKGMRFHDGRELTTEDVAFTINVLATRRWTYYHGYFASVDRAEAADRYTVKMYFKKPDSQFVLNSLTVVRIMPKHVIPNVTPIVLVEVVVRTATAMLTESSLSFLGLGDPTIRSWGTVLHFAMVKNALILGMWWFPPPGLMIALTVMSVMIIGRGLEIYFNPRLRKY